MVNFGLNSASILGIALAAAGASLYFLRTIRPELSRDHDIFFAAIGLLCGFILLFQGWRLDPILQFGQLLLSGSAVFFAIESIRLRGLATDQARRNTPIVDDDRPVSRVYRAELDQIEPYQTEERYERRLRGYEEPRPSRSRGYEDDVPAAPRSGRQTRNRPPVDGDRPSRPPTNRRPAASPGRRPTAPSRRPTRDNGYDDYQQGGVGVTDVWSEDAWDESGRVEDSSRRPRRPRPEDEVSRRPRRPRPDDYAPQDDVATVDYQPVDNMPFGEEDQDWDDQPTDDAPEGDRPGNPVNFDY